MSDDRSTRDIERELEQERAELQRTLDELADRLTFSDAWDRAGRYMRNNRGDLSRTLGRTAREKPLAVALTAVGIAWLIFGPAQVESRRVPRRRALPPPRDPLGSDRDERHAPHRAEAFHSDRHRADEPVHGTAAVPAKGYPGAEGPHGDPSVANSPTSTAGDTTRGGPAGTRPASGTGLTSGGTGASAGSGAMPSGTTGTGTTGASTTGATGATTTDAIGTAPSGTTGTGTGRPGGTTAGSAGTTTPAAGRSSTASAGRTPGETTPAGAAAAAGAARTPSEQRDPLTGASPTDPEPDLDSRTTKKP